MTTYIATGMNAVTKKAFKEAVKAGFNVTMSEAGPHSSRFLTLRDLHDIA